jgi:hypothetical protein
MRGRHLFVTPCSTVSLSLSSPELQELAYIQAYGVEVCVLNETTVWVSCYKLYVPYKLFPMEFFSSHSYILHVMQLSYIQYSMLCYAGETAWRPPPPELPLEFPLHFPVSFPSPQPSPQALTHPSAPLGLTRPFPKASQDIFIPHPSLP